MSIKSNPASAWLALLVKGDEVRWTDPDDNVASGDYTIMSIETESGTIEALADTVWIKNDAGSEAEVFASELSPASH